MTDRGLTDRKGSVTPLHSTAGRYRSVFISDVHLGTRGCQAERLAAFLDSSACDRLYLVGDIIDGWRMSRTAFWPPAHTEVVRKVLSMSAAGTEVIYVTGNHDECLRGYSDLQLGNIALVDRTIHTAADGRAFMVVHGDEFDVVTRYHRWLAVLGDAGYNLLLWLNRILNWFRRRLHLGYWSLSQWVKQRVKQAVNFVGEYEEAVAHQARALGVDGVICGHIHHAEIRQMNGVQYMNCGDWVESCTALVEDQSGQFHVLRFADRATESTALGGATLSPVGGNRRAA